MSSVLGLVSGVAGIWTFRGSLKLLSSPHLRGGDKGLLRGILSGNVWNGFLLEEKIVPCRFCGGP